jgi:NADH-ubiquinone oxidoreductase chain 5
MFHNSPEFIINFTETYLGKKIYSFLNGKYYFDVIYNHYIISAGLQVGYSISKYLDRGVIELIGPYGLSIYSSKLAQNISKLDDGKITTYGLYMIIGLIILIFISFSTLLFENNLIEPRLIIILFLAIFLLPFLSNYNYLSREIEKSASKSTSISTSNSNSYSK